MKIAIQLSLFALVALASSGHAQGTAFTYQGRLIANGQPATGGYDLTFILCDAANGQNLLATNALSNLSVTGGLFTATLDFGASAFDGAARWLEIGVRTNGSLADFAALTPRQPLTPSPYAFYADTAATVTNGSITGAKLAPNAVTAAALSTPAAPAAGQVLTYNGASLDWQSTSWSLTGNAGTSAGANFLGTLDPQPLLFMVNNTRALRLEPTGDTPNFIGGFSGNVVAPGLPGGTIGGGGTAINDQPNRITNNGYYGTIAGGYHNTVGGYAAAIGGGSVNTASGDFATIAAGQFNTASYPDTTVSGGRSNRATYYSASVGGGVDNVASGSFSMVAGGGHNSARGIASFVGGGGGDNGLGLSFPNRADGDWSVIGGGVNNTIQGATFASAIGGGAYNTNGGNYATVAGGSANTAGGQFSTVPGGQQNAAMADYSFAAGHRAKALNQGSFVWADSTAGDFSSTANDQFLIRARGGVGIGVANPTTALDVAGGARATGLLRNGSEVGTSEAPSPTGLVVRRINSTDSTAGQVVARTDTLTLERNGSPGGMTVRNRGSIGIKQTVNWMGIDRTGTPRGRTISFDNFVTGAGLTLFDDSEHIVHVEISFGRTYDAGQHLTQLVLDRYDDGVTHDNYWSGTLTSTYNQ